MYFIDISSRLFRLSVQNKLYSTALKIKLLLEDKKKKQFPLHWRSIMKVID